MGDSPAIKAAEAPALLKLEGIGKRFGEFAALADIDIAFNPGEVHCLLGENGAGKSTLCNLVFGIHQPTAGAMTYEGEAYRPANPRDALARRIAMVHQHFSLVDELSVTDNLLLGKGLGRVNRKAEAQRLLDLATEFGLSLDPAALVGALSVGQRQRVEIVKCLMRRPQLLILDEPTAVLLPEEIESLLQLCRRVADSGCAVVLVTHKLAEIARVADRATVLRAGKVVARSQSPAGEIDALVRAMIRREDAGEGGDKFGVDALPERTARTSFQTAHEALQLDAISAMDAIGVKRLDAITLSIRQGEIVGIAGVEGNGQSELGMILAGLARPSEGRWFANGHELTTASPAAITAAGVGIVPEDRHKVGAIGQLPLADNIFLNRMAEFTRFGMIDRKRRNSAAAELVSRFDIRTAGTGVPFSSLSGGNQQKAVLARELTTPGLKFLLAANPTRGLDIGAVEAVYRFIMDAARSGVGVLLISSELDELLAVAHRIAVFYRGRIIGERPAEPQYREDIGALMSGQTP